MNGILLLEWPAVIPMKTCFPNEKSPECVTAAENKMVDLYQNLEQVALASQLKSKLASQLKSE